MTTQPAIAPNVGTLMAAALAAAGCTPCDIAGRAACETDYLAISGATFPASVTREQMERFNHVTYLLPDDVASEVRYEALAAFWHGSDAIDRRIDEIERMTA